MVMATMVLVRLGPEDRHDQDREHEARHRHDEIHHPRDRDVDERPTHSRKQPSAAPMTKETPSQRNQ